MGNLSSDVNYIFAVVNPFDDFADKAKKYSESRIVGKYKQYYLLFNTKKTFCLTYGSKIRNALQLVLTSLNLKLNEYANEEVDPQEFQKEVLEEIKSKIKPGVGTNFSFVKYILSDYSILDLLDDEKKKACFEKFVDKTDDDVRAKLSEFEDYVLSSLKVRKIKTDGYMMLKEDYAQIREHLTTLAEKYKLFQTKQFREDFEISAELLTFIKRDEVKIDFLTSDKPMNNDLLTLKKLGKAVKPHYFG